MGPRASQDLRSPSPIMAPGSELKNGYGPHTTLRFMFIIWRINTLKDVRANCFCASLLRTQIQMPRHIYIERAR